MKLKNNQIWKILNGLEVVSIVVSSPRPGVDFLQSLFDNHENVLTFDGWLLFYEFYTNAISLNGTYKYILGVNNNDNKRSFKYFNLEYIFYEFAWTHLNKFDSRYDDLEKKGHLGINKNEYNKIDINKYVQTCLDLIKDVEVTRKNLFIVIYAAYGICRNEDITKKKVLIHQAHLSEFLHEFIEDFPDAKIIGCMRDQRNYVTYINKWFHELYPLRTCITGSEYFIKIALFGTYNLRSFNPENIRISILEKLHENPEAHLKKICKWLRLNFSKNLLESSWNGKLWSGDILSNDIVKTFDKNRYNKSKLLWSNMSFIDKKIIECLLYRELNHYGYTTPKNTLWYIGLPILIALPTKYEISQTTHIIREKNFRLLLILFSVSIKRRFLFVKKYLLNLNRKNVIYNFF